MTMLFVDLLQKKKMKIYYSDKKKSCSEKWGLHFWIPTFISKRIYKLSEMKAVKQFYLFITSWTWWSTILNVQCSVSRGSHISVGSSSMRSTQWAPATWGETTLKQIKAKKERIAIKLCEHEIKNKQKEDTPQCRLAIYLSSCLEEERHSPAS